jgi:hypothetical protein
LSPRQFTNPRSHPSGSGCTSEQGNDDGNGDTQAKASNGDPDFYQRNDSNWGRRGD